MQHFLKVTNHMVKDAGTFLFMFAILSHPFLLSEFFFDLEPVTVLAIYITYIGVAGIVLWYKAASAEIKQKEYYESRLEQGKP